MDILYVIKENPNRALGHAADRARNFIYHWQKQGHHVTCVFPSSEINGFSEKRSIAEKMFSFLKSYHERRAGIKFQQTLLTFLKGKKFDFLITEELAAAVMIAPIKKSLGFPFVYVAHNVESDLYPQIIKPSLIEKLRSFFLLRLEKKIVQDADFVFAFSQEDQRRLIQLSGKKQILLTRAGTSLQTQFKPDTSKDRVLFIGALDYFPNFQALEWYANFIHPLIKSKYILTVAGRNPSSSIIQLCQKNEFELLPSPEKMDKILDRGILEVVPLLSGSGTRGKILEASAHFIPVISTTLGAQGLGFTHQKNIWLADSAVDFARGVDLFLSDSKIRKSTAENALIHVKKFDYSKVVQDFVTELSNFL